MDRYNNAIKLLEKYKQNYIKEQLEKYKNEELLEQVLSINFEEIEELKKQITGKKEIKNETIEKVVSILEENLTKEEIDEYKKIGSKYISQGKYAVVTMAGGQRNKARAQWT